MRREDKRLIKVVVAVCIGLLSLTSWIGKASNPDCKSNICIVKGYHQPGNCSE